MEEVKQVIIEIKIRKEEATKKDGKTKFDAYKVNIDGKAVQLGWRKDSQHLDTIPYGVSVVKVKNFSDAVDSFYPKVYATFVEIVPRQNQ